MPTPRLASPVLAPPPLPALFDRLLADIVGGKYPAGARLPAERDLARLLGASRPTLREALGRLGEWGLIEARRGSGVVVRDQREWSLEVLPAWLRHGAPARSPDALARMVLDLLALRRALFVDLLRVIGDRIDPTTLLAARAAVARAWGSRRDGPTFIREDIGAIRILVEGARFLPALWLLNGLGRVYEDIARALTGAATVPPDYLASYRAVFDALARRRTERACRALGHYLDRHDRRLIAALGIATTRVLGGGASSEQLAPLGVDPEVPR
ncbi:MAG: FadR family transcriptional regulator [Myxococcales bacterium]|nr:FadR family transcriptional regulator [Myxococcales bacterium]